MAKFTNSAEARWNAERNRLYWQSRQEGTEFEEPSFATMNREVMEVDTLAAIYSLTDKVLTKSQPTVHFVDDPDMTVPAMNDGKDIYISTTGHSPRVNNMDIPYFHGLNYHEVAHLLYSPRAGSEVGKWLKENDNYLRAFNILEDGRIEVLLTHKHPTVIPFLNKACIDLLTENINPENFLITRGRRHLPLEVRQLFAGLAVQKFGADKVRALAECIDEFRLLNIFQQPARAKAIVMEFAALIEDMAPPSSPNGCGQPVKDQWGRTKEKARPVMKAGRTETPKNIQDLLNEIAKTDQQAEDLENLDGWDKEPDGEQDGNGNGNGEQDGEGEGEQDGNGSSAAKQALEQAVSDAAADPTLTKESSRIRKMVRESLGKAVVNNIKKANPQSTVVSPQARITAVKFARELEQLQSDTDPSWVVEQPSGRVNIQRYMRRDPNALNKIFDRWSEGNYTHEIEAVILTDCSGSMGAVMQQANEATWIIKRALESIQSNVTSYAFNDNAKLIYGSDERTNASTYRNPQSSGGTNPFDCILAAQRLFMGSQKTTKLLFMVTDGYWSNSTQCDQILREMEKDGVVTISIYLESSYYRSNQNRNPLNIRSAYYAHCSEREQERIETYKHAMTTLFHDAMIKHWVTSPNQIVEVAKSVAKSQIKAAL